MKSRKSPLPLNNDHVDTGETLNEASNVIFEDIFPDKKYRYSNRYNFHLIKRWMRDIEEIDNLQILE